MVSGFTPTSTTGRGSPPGSHAEPEPRAFANAGRHPQPHLVRGRDLASPPQAGHHSDQTSPRPPHRGHVRRSGTCSGTSAPQKASCGLTMISADNVASRGPAEKRIAHPVEHVGDGRKINRDFVAQPVGARLPRHEAFASYERRRSASRSTSNARDTSRNAAPAHHPRCRDDSGAQAAGRRA